MSLFWAHLLGFFIFLMVAFIIALSNLFALKSLERYTVLDQTPSVTVLIPARNEEANIRLCVTSLLTQNYPSLQVVVLDDNSTDNTGAILLELKVSHINLEVIQGKPLPNGWTGKNWACHQLAQIATSELVLFVDADTTFEPDAISHAVAALLKERADFVTVLPRQIVATWGEKLVVPIMNWSIFSIIPYAIAHRVRTQKLVMAVGQFMLFRLHTYHEIGGHEAIRGEFLDDLPLAKRIKKQGFRWRLFNGSKLITCRMYHNFREVSDGLARSLFTVFGKNTLAYLWIWICLGITFLEPLIFIILHLFGLPIEILTLNASIVMLIISLILWGIVYLRFRYPFYLTFFFPLTIILSFYIAMRSLIITKTGRMTWKGRVTKN